MVACLFAPSMYQPHYQKQTCVTSFFSNTIGIAETNTNLPSPAIILRRNVHSVFFCISVAICNTADEINAPNPCLIPIRCMRLSSVYTLYKTQQCMGATAMSLSPCLG